DAVVAIEKNVQREGPSTDRQALIAHDFRDGDRLAVNNGESRQLEVAGTVAGDRERTILTTKTHIKYGSHDYVVGGYVPVMPPTSDLQTEDTKQNIRLREETNQLMYGLATADAEAGLEVRVADAVRQQPQRAADPDPEIIAIKTASEIYQVAKEIAQRSKRHLLATNIRIGPGFSEPPDYADARSNYVNWLAGHLHERDHCALDYKRAIFLGPGNCRDSWEYHELKKELTSLLA